MKLPQDAVFRQQRRRYLLRHTCEHCALFDPDTEACAHGFPPDEHREAHYEDPQAPVVFCKEFELR